MNKKLAGLGLPVFFILPWLGFCLALFNVRSKTTALIYISFAMLFGYAISFSDTSADSYRYAQAFARFDNRLDYDAILYMYRSGELRDLYRLLLYYFTSIFTNNPKVMYAFAGFFYGVFSYLNLRIFAANYKGKPNKYVLILGIVFFTYVSLANINGFRFWTATMVFFYAAYHFIIQKKYIWIIGIFMTPLIHYGFILFAPLIILYGFLHPFLYNDLKVNKYIYYMFIVLFIFSWFLNTNSISLSFLSGSNALSGEAFDRMGYVNSDRTAKLVEERKDTSLFLGVQNYFLHAIKIYIFIVILFVYKKIKTLNIHKNSLNSLLVFVLFFYSFAFIANTIPSGGRFMNIAHLFLMLLMIQLFQLFKSKKYKLLILFAFPIFSFHILFTNFLLPILILSPEFWYGNIFWIIMEGLNVNIH